MRLAKRTRAPAFVVMLTYYIIKELTARWQSLNITVEGGIKELAQLCCIEVHLSSLLEGKRLTRPGPECTLSHSCSSAVLMRKVGLPQAPAEGHR